MHRSRIIAVASSIACLIAAAFVSGTFAPAADASTRSTTFVVLAQDAGSAQALASRLEDLGARVTRVNSDIGLITVTTTSASFRGRASRLSGVYGVARDQVIGHAPDQKPHQLPREIARGSHGAPGHGHGHGSASSDPLDAQLWGMKMINADQAHRVTLGSKKVRVGIMDTGVDAAHPDLHANFDYRLSRNFVTDIPAIDGACEHPSCKDPVGEDDDGHGTHVAGTIAAALNGFGVSGVAPDVDLVEVRAGQDSGYFFLQPTVDALTYSADAGIDVVNMSFYVDPWLYNCAGGAPEDTPEQAAEQDTIIAAMNRALAYAHHRNVTLVAASGNENSDLANPPNDTSSPDYGEAPHERTIDNATCLSLPTENPYVIGVDALGPSGKKSDFSNYTTDLTSGEVDLSAPGGWYRDGFGTASYRTNGNLILSTYPLNVAQANGDVDQDGTITAQGEAFGVQKDCPARPVRGADRCGYYQFLQGTSMASPHATGVAALAISAHGRNLGRHRGFGMSPDAVLRLLSWTATDHACPSGGVQSYTQEGRDDSYTATCVGTPEFNGFYGAGIVNAYGVVRHRW